MNYKDLQKQRQAERLIKLNKESKLKTEPNRKRRPVKNKELGSLDFALGL